MRFVMKNSILAVSLCALSSGAAFAQSTDDTVVVTGLRYAEKEASAGTKSEIPLNETPMSIQVVSRGAMDDLQVVGLKEGISYVSGVVPAGYAYYDSVQIRGFTNGAAANFRDNLQLQAITGFDMALVEQIEVVKGPAAMLYGRIEPGGLVNLVTKRPQEKAAVSLQQQVGDFGFLRTTADATGKVTSDGTLLYRLVGSYSQSDSFIDYVQEDNVVGGAYLTWRPDDRFELQLDLERQNNRFMDTEDQGIPIIGNRAAPVPRNRYFGDPVNWDIPNEQDRTLLAANWTYRIDDSWSLTQRAHWQTLDGQQLTLWDGGFDGVDTITRGIWFVKPERETAATNIDLAGDVKLGGMRHRLLVGVDWFNHTTSFHGYSDIDSSVVPPISLTNPTYGVSAAAIRALPENFFFATEEGWIGVYVQDQISLTDSLELLVGGRYDWAEDGNGFSSTSLAEADSILELADDKAFSPRVGLLYKISPDFSVYGSFSRSFGSNNGRSATGERLDPEEGEQLELGFKSSLMDDALTITASVFELTKSNVLTPDLSTPDPDDSTTLGEVRNRGLELDIAGQITPNLSLIAGYAYSDATITRDNSGIEGNRMFNVPRNAASVWAKYDVDPGATSGLELGVGLRVIGERQGDDANSWQMPGYERVDAMAGYRMRFGDVPVKLQVNVENLLDETYIDRGSFNAKYGAPRTVIGSLRVDF